MDTGNPIIDAQIAFARERRRRRRAEAARRLLRRPPDRLASLDQDLDGTPPAVRKAGMCAVSLDSIVGTAEPAKARVFDAAFRPRGASRERWERIWLAGHRGTPLPPVSLFRVGDRHFVSDGHHRVSVAHALGMSAIDAEVTELASAA